VPVTEAHVSTFASGEDHCRFSESVRGSDVFIFQSHGEVEGRSVNDAIMEQLIMVDAARRASAKRITAVIPFYGYGRQDRKAEGREPITARLVADLFTAAGASRLVSIDLHSGQIQGFFNGPVDHLTAMPVLVDHISHLGRDLVVVSPDAGRVKVAERYAQQLHADLAIVHKRRVNGLKNAVEAKDVVGEVSGRICVLIDDMIDTAGTICQAAELLMERGAHSVTAAATHGVFSGPAIDRMKNSVLDRVIVTDTLPLGPDKHFDKLEVLSVAPLIADAIRAVFEDASVSQIFGGHNQS
jgi:ribose-phosphate pyrophosphokinase